MVQLKFKLEDGLLHKIVRDSKLRNLFIGMRKMLELTIIKYHDISAEGTQLNSISPAKQLLALVPVGLYMTTKRSI